MFLVNSRYRRFSATPLGSASKLLHLMRAHLLPKLRCHFAEFLNQSSLKRLGMLCPPTCVGLRYGHQMNSLRGFSRKHGITDFVSLGLSTSPLSVEWRRGFAYATRLQACTGISSTRISYPSPSPLRSNTHLVVREY